MKTTFIDICNAIKDGVFPKVSYNGIIGKVVVLKDSGKYKGVGVDLGNKWDDWFYDSDSVDKRSKYVRDLIIL